MLVYHGNHKPTEKKGSLYFRAGSSYAHPLLILCVYLIVSSFWLAQTEVKHYDVVITTYGTMIAQFPKKVKKQVRNPALSEDEMEAEPPTYGVLARIEWFRIVSSSCFFFSINEAT